MKIGRKPLFSGIAVLLALVLVARLVSATLQASRNGTGGPALTSLVSTLTVLVVVIAAGVPMYVLYRRRRAAIRALRSRFPNSLIITTVGYDDFRVGIQKIARSDFGPIWETSIEASKMTRYMIMVFSPNELTFWNGSGALEQVGAIPKTRIVAVNTGSIPYAYGERAALVVNVDVGEVVRLPVLIMKDTGGGWLPRNGTEIESLIQAIQNARSLKD